MDTPVRVRYARVEDAAEMARVNVRSWRETYRGVMADRVLDDPGLPAARERFWTAMLSDERYRANRVAVAERGGEVIGIAMAGPLQSSGSQWGTHLYVLYVVAAEHGADPLRAWPALGGYFVIAQECRQPSTGQTVLIQ
jgi:hypothetical protein